MHAIETREPKSKSYRRPASGLRHLAGAAVALAMVAGCATLDLGSGTGISASRTRRRRLPRNADVTTRRLFDLESESLHERCQAAESLRYSPPERRPEVAAALAKALKDSSKSVRIAAAGSLFELKKDAAPAAAQLREALSDPAGKVVINASLALRRLDVPPEELVPTMRVVLEGSEMRIVPRAADLLMVWGVPLSDVMPHLLRALACDDVEARKKAARELLDEKTLPVQSVPAVQARLADPDVEVRSCAALLLGAHYDPPPPASLPALIDLLQREQDVRVQSSIVTALSKYGPAANAAGPRLVALALGSPDASLRRNCGGTIGQIEFHSEEAVTALRTLLLKDEDRSVRVAAAHSLADFGAAAVPALGDLEAAAQNDPEEYVRKLVARDHRILVGSLGPGAEQAIPHLLRYARSSENETLRLQAVRALGMIGQAAEEVVPVLEKALLGDASWRVRNDAALSLAKFGPKAAPALESLRKARENDPEQHVKIRANIAIQQIEGTRGP